MTTLRLPPELSIGSIAQELQAAGLAQMGQGTNPDDVVGLLLLTPQLLELLALLTGGGTDPDAPTIVAPEILWGFFPGNGEYQPLPAGVTTFDLVERSVASDNTLFTTPDLNIAKNVLDAAKSLIVIPDGLVKIELGSNSPSTELGVARLLPKLLPMPKTLGQDDVSGLS